MALVNEAPVALAEMHFACGCSLRLAGPALLLPRGPSARASMKQQRYSIGVGCFRVKLVGRSRPRLKYSVITPTRDVSSGLFQTNHRSPRPCAVLIPELRGQLGARASLCSAVAQGVGSKASSRHCDASCLLQGPHPGEVSQKPV